MVQEAPPPQVTDPNSLEAHFIAYLSLLSKDQRLAAIRRVGVCPKCGEMAAGHRCEVVAGELDEWEPRSLG